MELSEEKIDSKKVSVHFIKERIKENFNFFSEKLKNLLISAIK